MGDSVWQVIDDTELKRLRLTIACATTKYEIMKVAIKGKLNVLLVCA